MIVKTVVQSKDDSPIVPDYLTQILCLCSIGWQAVRLETRFWQGL